MRGDPRHASRGCRVGALATLVLTALVLAGAAPAAADAPLAVGWWNVAHQGVAPPAPPDVGAKDLLVQGGPQPSAVTGLRFVVPDGATVVSLVLPLAAGSAPPRAEAVTACPTTKAWEPAANGAWAAVPTWSCQRFAPAVLSADGAALVVADIARLVADDGSLSIALVPGSSDRIVLAPPPPTALQVVPAARAPEPAAVAPPPAAPVPAAPPPPPPLRSGVVPLAPLAAVVLVQAPQVGPAPPPVPVVRIGADAVTGATPVAAAREGVADDGRTRLVLAVEALLVLIFFGLLGVGPFGWLARLTGQPVLAADRPRGVGRFAAARVGKVPSL